ncbi:ESX secretion-associated protein EspG [Gandjariella thermophila]|uniref:ESX secretion-associated protein EspG n=1 Tax=Gandjariella thermophila TaxID=1931992 RepID=A0A4D4JBW1_9PSEU|nr:ESX secretion-associated protein EspG [Gandjariella thermophila]GDY32822.1 ESX secretion-associated protein EspG [Gandjariella thermophila]
MSLDSGLWLDDLELDVLWHLAGGGRVPYPLEITWHGVTGSERRVLEQRALAGLRTRGLVERGPRGPRPAPEVEDVFALLARPRLTVDAFLGLDDLVRAVAASFGRAAVLAVQTADGTTFRRIRSTNLVGEIVGLLPARPAGRGYPVSVPAEVLAEATDAAGGEPGRFEALLSRGGVPGNQARALLVAAQGATGSGQFGATASDRVHGLRRASRVVSWFDTEEGRFFLSNRRGMDGRVWTTVVGADTPKLIQAVTELVAEVDPDA